MGLRERNLSVISLSEWMLRVSRGRCESVICLAGPSIWMHPMAWIPSSLSEKLTTSSGTQQRNEQSVPTLQGTPIGSVACQPPTWLINTMHCTLQVTKRFSKAISTTTDF